MWQSDRSSTTWLYSDCVCVVTKGLHVQNETVGGELDLNAPCDKKARALIHHDYQRTPQSTCEVNVSGWECRKLTSDRGHVHTNGVSFQNGIGECECSSFVIQGLRLKLETSQYHVRMAHFYRLTEKVRQNEWFLTWLCDEKSCFKRKEC